MSTPTHRPYFIVCRPEQVNGRQAAHYGKLLLHLLNYTELLVERPEIKDETLQVFEVEAPTELVRVQQEGDRVVHLLWAGEKHARNRPNELVTVPIRSLVPFVSDASAASPVEVAGAVFAGFPPTVQLAAAILNVDDAALTAAGLSPETMRKWAQLQVSAASAAGSAG